MQLMLFVIHGDHQTKSREELQAKIAKARQMGYTDITTYDGRTCTLTDLTQTIESHSLFGDQQRLTIIENLFRRRSKTELKEITEYLGHINSNDASVIIWEDRLLSVTQLKPLVNFQKNVFPLPKVIFSLTDSLTPKANPDQVLSLLDKACNADSAELVLIMLARQLRLHLQKKSRSFSTSFQPKTLISFHHQLAEIDIKNKTGQLSLDLRSELANWIVKVYSK